MINSGRETRVVALVVDFPNFPLNWCRFSFFLSVWFYVLFFSLFDVIQPWIFALSLMGLTPLAERVSFLTEWVCMFIRRSSFIKCDISVSFSDTFFFFIFLSYKTQTDSILHRSNRYFVLFLNFTPLYIWSIGGSGWASGLEKLPHGSRK